MAFGTIIHHHHTVYPTVAAAQYVADVNNAAAAEDNDAWEYRVANNPNGIVGAVVKVYDETGYFLGML